MVTLPGLTAPLRERLRSLPFKIAYECYVHDNWEIFLVNPDGSNPVNLTGTLTAHEHYPQVSPDGTQICFSVDEGEGRETVRSLCVMDLDGRNRRRIAGHAREPFWTPDSKRIGFLFQEYPKFNVIDYYTRGMCFFDLSSGAFALHPNSTNLHHLYNPTFAVNGKWIVASVHGGMGIGHGVLAVEAQGMRVFNLEIPGCRPCLSPDGAQIAWGAGDYEIAVAPIRFDGERPMVETPRLRIVDARNRIIHVDWSPDSRFLCFSRGPAGKGDPTKAGTFSGSCGLVGVHAEGWNLCVVSAERDGRLDLQGGELQDFVLITTNGCSNKEPAWFQPHKNP